MRNLLFLMLVFPVIIHAQSDTIYLDKKWGLTTKHQAWYAKAYTHQDSIIKVKDMLIKKNIELYDYYRLLDSDITTNKNGYYIYYDIHNHKRREGRYMFNKMNGTWKFYWFFSDNIKYEKTFAYGVLNGAAIYYDSDTHKKEMEYQYLNNKKNGVSRF